MGGIKIMAGVDQQEADRKNYSDLIIDSPARKKIIVAGPGTGKTFTFKELLKQKGGKSLALTFINNLVRDLEEDLDGLAETKTFHAFCVKLLYKKPFGGIDDNFRVFPKLPEIIKSDERILFEKKSNSDFGEAFQCLIEDDRIGFYIDRGNFYNAVGFYDSVYRVLQYFKSGGEPPSYNQVVIDEFQDFNQLEVAFIDELEKVNPILIVGDDDQAIYPFSFRYASPDFIRKKAADSNYTRFKLPYCSRCTEIIIDAVNDIITHAKGKGKLRERFEKELFCYLPYKKQDCVNYPNIIHAICSVQTKKSPYISKFIEREIQNIPAEEKKLAKEKGYPCVLIIGPPNRRPYNYLEQINKFLSEDYKIDYTIKKRDYLHILDGYKYLLKNKKLNLGWRIILECDEIDDMEDIIKQTDIDRIDVVKKLPKEYKSKHETVIDCLNRLKENKASTEEQKRLEEILALSLNKIKNKLGIEEECENNIEESESQEETDQLSIKITTFLGAKGLSGGFVFIVGLNNGTIPEHPSSPTDNEICQFIVALTRARKKCYLISNKRMGPTDRLKHSTFIDWIDSSKLERIRVYADYFR